MVTNKAHNTAACMLAGVLCLLAPRAAEGVEPIKLSGSITGVVNDSRGVPQMGATVTVYNRQDRQVGKILSDSNGQFRFAGLFPSLYSLRVTLASFVPAIRKDIAVEAGQLSRLRVSLNTLFSSIQLDYPNIESGSLISDDWKWVLRSASDVRPVMRFREDPVGAGQNPPVALFADTRGILRFSAGDGQMVASTTSEADLGTAFALETSLYGNSLLQMSGNFGYGSQTGVPAAAFRTSYSRELAGGKPVVSVTMRQLYLPERMGPVLAGTDAGVPILRSLTASVDNRTQVADSVSVQYGTQVDMVSFLDHLTYLSPYARLAWAMDNSTDVEVAYSSGNARPEMADGGMDDAELRQDLNTLGMFPRLSLAGGHTRLQRGEEYEVAVARKIGSRAVRLSAYREAVSDAALAMVAPAGFFMAGNIVPDLFSNSSVFNAGNFDMSGLDAAFTQNLGERASVTVSYGNEGALTAWHEELVSDSPDELRSMIHAARRQAVTARFAMTAPRTGTHLIASYQIALGDARWVMAGNPYSMQPLRALPGLNVSLRQPIPGLGKRVEATAELRNILAQGYLGIDTSSGQLLLVDNPRSVRGGLAFIF
ncbi:MAG: carboxypeptidase-like regulatory domain-containing protein [Bryobacteraceae bacterium]